jgi:histidyl-tRNA synthetase
VAVIIGPDEMASGLVTIRPLRHTGSQASVPVGDVVEAVREAGRGEGASPSTVSEVP